MTIGGKKTLKAKPVGKVKKASSSKITPVKTYTIDELESFDDDESNHIYCCPECKTPDGKPLGRKCFIWS